VIKFNAEIKILPTNRWTGQSSGNVISGLKTSGFSILIKLLY
jgi:hypothetical protein